MNSKIKLIVNIICLRERLNELTLYRGSLLDPEIIYTSQLLDSLLNDYHKATTEM
jgi:hypothetical protein